MLAKAWACALAALLCSAVWAEDQKRAGDDVTVTVVLNDDVAERLEAREAADAARNAAREIRREVRVERIAEQEQERREIRESFPFSGEDSEEILEALRDALEDARREIEHVHEHEAEHIHKRIHIEASERDDIREALREVLEESRGALNEAGEAMRELMAQTPTFTVGMLPHLTLGDAGAGNSRPVDERRSAAGVSEIEVQNVSGRITIVGWENDEIHIEGYIGEDVEKLEFEIDGSDAEVRVKIPENRRRNNLKIKSELTIHVPVRLNVEAHTVSGGIEARGLQGARVDIETVSGGVKVSQCTGDIEASATSGGIEVYDAVKAVDAECVSGSVTVKGTPTSVSVESVSGSVTIEGVQNEVEVESVSGRTSVKGGRLSSFSSENVSGGLDYVGGMAPGGRFDLNTLSGGIDIDFTEDVSADFNLQSFSGGITVNLPGAPTSGKKHLSFKTGDGSGSVDVEAFSGGIRIDRK